MVSMLSELAECGCKRLVKPRRSNELVRILYETCALEVKDHASALRISDDFCVNSLLDVQTVLESA